MRSRVSTRQTVEGFAFADYIKTESSTRHHFDGSSAGTNSMRSFLLPLILFLALGILFVRLFSLQIIHGAYYRNLSDNNRIKTTIIHAPRGIIFDRSGIPLVFNTPGFRKVEKVKTALLSREQAMQQIAKGENLEVDSLRQYPYKDAMAHVLGYIGQITQDELQDLNGYQLGDLIGKVGIEGEYEKYLKGIDGKQLVEVDYRGKSIRTLGEEDPIPGRDITLSLDARLQQASFLAMENVKKGAVIVSSPKGEILSLISKPAFDPNLFTQGVSYKTATTSGYQNIESIIEDNNNQPLLNRAISGTYPPGSTFKLVTAAAGLESKSIDENFTVLDTGVLQVGVFSFGNWYFLQYGKTEGEVDLVKAIKRSNDIFFYKVAEETGVDRLSEMAKQFGLGQQLGIDLQGEAEGIVPSMSWKQKEIGEAWYLGDTYHYGIGQGYLLTTPLQVNAWTQTIVNGGTLYLPRLIKNTTNTTNKPIRKDFLNPKNIDLIRRGMIESCSPGGVAWPLFELRVENGELKIDGKNFMEVPQSTTSASFKDWRKVVIACKTGTAEHGGKDSLPHAWITLFAPAYDPEIVVTVLAESSGEGSNVAAPVAKKILEEWFSR